MWERPSSVLPIWWRISWRRRRRDRWGALRIAILEEDDLEIFAEEQYAIKDALCLWSDVPELMEGALRVYQGRAFTTAPPNWSRRCWNDFPDSMGSSYSKAASDFVVSKKPQREKLAIMAFPPVNVRGKRWNTEVPFQSIQNDFC